MSSLYATAVGSFGRPLLGPPDLRSEFNLFGSGDVFSTSAPSLVYDPTFGASSALPNGGIMLPAPTPSKQAALNPSNQILGQALLEEAIKAEADPLLPPSSFEPPTPGLPPLIPPGMGESATVVIDAGQASEGRRPQYDEYVEVRPTRPSRTTLGLVLGGVAAASMVGLPLLMRELNARDSTGDQAELQIPPEMYRLLEQTTTPYDEFGRRIVSAGGRNIYPPQLDQLFPGRATAVNTMPQQQVVVNAQLPTGYDNISAGQGAPRSATAPITSLVDNNPGGNRLQAPTAGVSGVDVPAAPRVSITKPLKRRMAEKVLSAGRDKPDVKVQLGGRRGGGIKVKLTPTEFPLTQTRSGVVLRPAAGTNQAGSSRLLASPASTNYASQPPSAKPSPASSIGSRY
jgi:hypothetical protein